MTRNHVILELPGWHVHVILEFHGEHSCNSGIRWKKSYNASTTVFSGTV